MAPHAPRPWLPLAAIPAIIASAPAACTKPASERGQASSAAPVPSAAEPESSAPPSSQTAAATGFVPAPPRLRAAAIGETAMLPAPLQRAFTPTDAFQPVAPPAPGEWLAVHRERGQSYDQFVRFRGAKPDEARRTLYLLPLGDFGEGAFAPLPLLAEFAGAYFALEVEILPPAPIESVASRMRVQANRLQLFTGDLLEHLRRRLPDDGFALIAITDTDLYPAPSWNFVFGEASLRGRVAVESLARYDPAFYGVEVSRETAEALALRRSLTVVAHEVGHIFGFEHCTFFRCAMNGAHDLRELDSAPLHLCPVCLRKLHRSVRFDPAERYSHLSRFYDRAGLEAEARWTRRRAEFVRARTAAGAH